MRLMRHRRVLAATCSRLERTRIVRAKDPPLALSEAWCVKEATYKALAQQFCDLRFEPRTLVTSYVGECPHPDGTRFRYRCAGLTAEIVRADGYVHAVAAYDESALASTVFAVRRGSGWRRESVEVRVLLGDLLRNVGCQSFRIRDRGCIPTVRARSGEMLASVSVSHDGLWRAAAVNLA